MMKAILVDDEKNSLEVLKIELNEYCPHIEIVGSFMNPLEAIPKIRATRPDLLFLDIDMPQMNGFDLVAEIIDEKIPVIFVTAYDQFAIKAFEFNAVDYLLKPIIRSKLIAAVTKVSEHKEPLFDIKSLGALLQNIKMQNGTGIENIAVPTKEGFKMVPIPTISYLEGDGNYTWIILGDGQKFLVTKTLKELEVMMRFPQFFRAHKSFIVNLNHVDRYLRGQGGTLIMKDGFQIPVARQHKPELLKLLFLD